MSALQKKILLIKPDYEFWPIGLAYVARSLVENEIKFDFIDTSIDKDPDWKGILKKGNYGVVATGGLIGSYTFYRNIFRTVKNIDPSLICILGGNVTTDLSSDVLFKSIPVDYLVIGEAEYTFPHLLKTLDKKLDPATVDGIVYRETDGKVTKTQRRPRVDISTGENRLPYWDFLDMPYYLNKFQNMPIMTGRGCTGRCTFCSPTNGQYMGRPVSHTIDEIKYLNSRYQFGSIGFLNEIFFPDDASIEEFCREYKKLEPLKPWGCLMRVDMNAEILEVMKDAGFRGGNIGVESGSDRVLKLINKEVTVEQIRKFINMAQKHRIPLEASFMMGNYGETADDIRQTIDLLIETRACGPMALTINYPGTSNYRMALRKKLVTDEVQYLESVDKIYGRNYFQVISDMNSGKVEYLNLSAMPTPELFHVVEKEMRRYYTQNCRVVNAKSQMLEDGSCEYTGNCNSCGGDLKHTVPANSLNYPFNRVGCPRCGVQDNYFSPFISDRYKYAFEPVAEAIKNAKRIALFCFEQEFYEFFKYDLFGINYDSIIGIVGHSGSVSSLVPPLYEGYVLNYPVLPIDKIAELGPDLLIVPGGFVPSEIRKELYTKCPILAERQVSLSLPAHRLFSDAAEYIGRARLQAEILQAEAPKVEAEPAGSAAAAAEGGKLPNPHASESMQACKPDAGTGKYEELLRKTILWVRGNRVLRAAKPVILGAFRSAGFTIVRTGLIEAERASARREIEYLIKLLEKERAATAAKATAVTESRITSVVWQGLAVEVENGSLELSEDGSALFVEDRANGLHRIMVAVTAPCHEAGSKMTVSILVRPTGRQRLRLDVVTGDGVMNGRMDVVLSGQPVAICDADILAGEVVQTGEYFQCTATVQAHTPEAKIIIGTRTGGDDVLYAGDGQSGIRLAQLAIK